MVSSAGDREAAWEQLLISVAKGEGRAHAASWRFETKAALDALAKAQNELPLPPQHAGIKLKRK